MNKVDSLKRLGPIADEMLAGLHADQQMKMRIQQAAREKTAPRRSMPRVLVPALCCAALAVCVSGALLGRLGAPAVQPAQIETIAAGSGAAAARMDTVLADLGDNARVGAAVPRHTSLFEPGETDIPLVTVDGAVYRMLSTPKTLSGALRGGEVGRVQSVTNEPSLASGDAMKAGLSNVAGEGAAIYGLKGVSSDTAVAAEVDGQVRVFQRVSYAGKGPGSKTLEDTFDVRGKVKTLELSGVGTLEGDAANEVIAVLLDHAALKSADASAKKQSLTVTLDSGVKLQLGVSGDTLSGCGGWSCPEFFEAFENAL